MTGRTLAFPRVVYRQRDLLRSFVWRDLAARYEGSLLGRLWPLIYPMLLLGIYHLVFARFLKLKFGEGATWLDGGYETTFYMLSGILPWLCFADTTARSTNVVMENSNLIKKIAFPSELLPTYVAVAQLIHNLISMGLFMIFYLAVCFFARPDDVSVSDGLRLASHLLYLPIPLFLQFLFSLGLGMLLSAANVFIRDLNQMMPVALLLWMLVSPIFYPVSMVAQAASEPGSEWMMTALKINPVYHLLSMYRAVFPSGDVPFPWDSCAIFGALSVVLFFLGHRFFLATKGLFPDEV